jgi:hypothetical protein
MNEKLRKSSIQMSENTLNKKYEGSKCPQSHPERDARTAISLTQLFKMNQPYAILSSKVY